MMVQGHNNAIHLSCTCTSVLPLACHALQAAGVAAKSMTQAMNVGLWGSVMRSQPLQHLLTSARAVIAAGDACTAPAAVAAAAASNPLAMLPHLDLALAVAGLLDLLGSGGDEEEPPPSGTLEPGQAAAVEMAVEMADGGSAEARPVWRALGSLGGLTPQDIDSLQLIAVPLGDAAVRASAVLRQLVQVCQDGGSAGGVGGSAGGVAMDVDVCA